jgi:hypothetical protein
MSNVLTEGTNLACAREASFGVQPTGGWFNLRPNDHGDIGSSIKKTSRTPITSRRQVFRPIVTDLDSGVPYKADITIDDLDNFMEGIFCAVVKHSGGTGVSKFRPTAVVDGGVAADEYTVAAGGALPANTLIVARGFQNALNNGLKVVVATSGNTAIKVATGSLVAEVVPAAPLSYSNPTVEVAGVQGASGDIGADASGNLTSTANIWTTVGLNVGQWIRLGDLPSGAAFAFANTAYVGFARVRAIAAGLLTLERRQWTVGAADTGVGKTIRVFFTSWCRNVALTHADFVKPSYAFEIVYPDLNSPGVAEYEYPLGNVLDEAKFELPLTSKATMELTFVGTNTPDPVTSRATGADAALDPVTELALSTATDVPLLQIQNVDESGLTTEFKSLTLSFKNNATPEKVIGTLGANRINAGRFEVMIDAEVIFTSSQVVKAIRDNRRVSLGCALSNADFGAFIDVIAMDMSEADREFPTNQSVKLKVKSTGFYDPQLQSTASISKFAYLPRS